MVYTIHFISFSCESSPPYFLTLRWQLIVEVVTLAMGDIMVFILMFFVVLTGFATGGYLFFGSDMRGFERPDMAVMTLFRYCLGPPRWRARAQGCDG